MSRILHFLWRCVPAALAAVGAWVLLWIYRPVRGLRYGDMAHDTIPGINRILDGNIFSVWGGDDRPLMMPFGLLVEAPAVWLTRTLNIPGFWGASEDFGQPVRQSARTTLAFQGDYLAASWAALALAAALVIYALWNYEALGGAWRRRLIATFSGIVLIANPLSLSAVAWGHPEEVLMTGALAAALIWTWRSQWRASAICLGLAVATKQPAMLVALPFLLAVPLGRRLRYAAWFVGTALIISLPPILLSLPEFIAQNHGAVSSGDDSATYYSLLRFIGFGSFVSQNAKWILIIICLALPLLLAWRRNWRLSATTVAALVVALSLTRCLIDPWNIVYYSAPALAGVLLLELAVTPPRWRIFPIGTLAVGLILTAGFQGWLTSIIHWANLSSEIAFLAAYCTLTLVAYILVFRRDPLAPLAWGAKDQTSSRRGRIILYSSLALAVVVVGITLINNARTPAPTGTQQEAREARARLFDTYREYPNAYWLGARPLPQGTLIEAKPVTGDKGEGFSSVPYGTPGALTKIAYREGAADTRLVAITYPPSNKRFQARLLTCRRGGKCPKDSTLVPTPLGRSLLFTDRDASGRTVYWGLILISPKGETIFLSGFNLSEWRPYAAKLQRLKTATRADLAAAVYDPRR